MTISVLKKASKKKKKKKKKMRGLYLPKNTTKTNTQTKQNTGCLSCFFRVF